MSNEQGFLRIQARLDAHNQTQLVQFWDELEPDQQQDLCDQIEALELDQIDRRIQDYVLHDHTAAVPTEFGPAPAYPVEPDGPEMAEKYARARAVGEERLKAGQVGAFVVAGGQGTRLGFDGPKGNYPISPVKQKTLFQLFAEAILATSRKYGTRCPWYIMTSPLNYQATRDILEANMGPEKLWP